MNVVEREFQDYDVGYVTVLKAVRFLSRLWLPESSFVSIAALVV